MHPWRTPAQSPCLTNTRLQKCPRGEWFPDSIFQGNTEFVSAGRVTDQGMDELRQRMPYADLGAFDRDRQLESVPDLFTVDLVTRYIAWKLGQRAVCPTPMD